MNNITIHMLQATGRLNPFLSKIQTLSSDAIEATIKLLPVKDIDIIFQDDPDNTIEHISIGGYTPNAHTIYISLDPTSDNFSENLKAHLGRQLVHELHHTMRWQNPGYGTTLLEALVSEGLADVFSYEVFPGEVEEWNKALTEKQLIAYKQLAEKEFYQPYDHSEWFFGTNPSRIPKWTGYTLGYSIVKDYVTKHPDQTAASLFDVEARKLIE